MPLFKFQCIDCQEQFEELVLSSSEKPSCLKCASGNVVKMVSLISSKGIASGCGSSCVPSKCGSAKAG
ncbi:MAG: zinc ribbon domain-containing protein [candidate division Zixibacteria bacterium]|nr:zinc ribbon domain-containing protein [candidate division Zixibacteria bacterium]